jgi:phage terminase large subunit-like protein
MFTPNGYEGTDSPNRADALVWAVTELAFGKKGLSPADLYGERGMLVG